MDFSQIWTDLPQFYASNLRGSLFTGLLTMGTFIFAVKTFIVVKLKEDVFGTEYYLRRLERHRKLDPSKNVNQYAQLKALTSVLFYTSGAALLSAVFQLTLGLICAPWSAFICLVAAFVSVSLLFWAMILVKMNLDIWLEDLEKQADQTQARTCQPS